MSAQFPMNLKWINSIKHLWVCWPMSAAIQRQQQCSAQKQPWILIHCWKCSILQCYFICPLPKLSLTDTCCSPAVYYLPLILTEHWNLECYIRLDSLPLSLVHSQQSYLCQRNFMRSIACYPEGDWGLCSLYHGPAFLNTILTTAISAFSLFFCSDIISKL